jgi:hypothetical protein
METYLVLGTRFCKKVDIFKVEIKCLFELRKKERKKMRVKKKRNKQTIGSLLSQNFSLSFIFIQSFTLTLISFFRMLSLSKLVKLLVKLPIEG